MTTVRLRGFSAGTRNTSLWDSQKFLVNLEPQHPYPKPCTQRAGLCAEFCSRGLASMICTVKDLNGNVLRASGFLSCSKARISKHLDLSD